MLNIEEIKARTETAREEGFGLQQFDDLDALIAEVERLNAELDERDVECETQYKLMAEKNKHIVTLKRALEIMHEFMSITEVGSRAKREYFTPDYFIQQAQEQEGKK